MNDLQIDYFMAVATNLSFTKTSEELFVSQPAISKQISLMEKELGRKTVHSKQQEDDPHESRQTVLRILPGVQKGTFGIPCTRPRRCSNRTRKLYMWVSWKDGILAEILPEVLRRFHDKYPNTRLAIDCCGVKELTTLLLTDNIQVALTMKNSLTDFNELYQNNGGDNSKASDLFSG